MSEAEASQDGLDLDLPCSKCHKKIGEHTIREWSEVCLADKKWLRPYHETPGGPMMLQGVKGVLAGAITIVAGYVDAAEGMGRLPMLQFHFFGPGLIPGSTQNLEPINLIMDSTGLKNVRQIFSQAVDKAILGARRGRGGEPID